MNLTLLAPLALLAAGLLVVPVLLHLIDQRRVPTQDFPALRFLRQAQKRLRKQSRVRDRWLLLARLLALLALILAAAAPLFTFEEEIPAGTELAPNVVFLLDRSLSMGLKVDGDETVFDRAVDRIETVALALPEGSRVGLVVFDRWPEDVIGGLLPDRRRVVRAAKDTSVGYGETDLRGAILAGVRALLASPEGGGDIYLLTDMTDSSLAGDTPIEIPQQLEGRVRLVVPRLHDGGGSNRALMGASISGGAVDDAPVSVTAKVSGSGVTEDAALDLFISGASVSRGFVDVSENKTIDKTFTLPADQKHSGPGRLLLSDDDLTADNAWYFRLSQRRSLRVLVLDGDPGMTLTSGESYFLERALSPSTAQSSRITPVVMAPGAAKDQRFSDYSVIFLNNVADPAPLAARLRAFVEAGGGLFITGGDNVSPERYNRALKALLPASLGQTIASAPDVTGDRAPSLGYPPVGHPVFRVFREAGAQVFGTTHFYRVIPTSPSLKENADILLKLSTGLPALLSRQVGKGRVLFFASTLDRGWSDFPMKSIFLPFIQESVHFLASNPATEGEGAEFVVGQPVPVSVPATTGPLTVEAPGGERSLLEVIGEEPGAAGAVALSRQAFRKTDLPGHYLVFEQADGSEPIERDDLSFAVNVPPIESQLGPMAPERLSGVLPDVPTVVEGQSTESQAFVTVTRKRKLAQPIMWLVLALLIVEGLMTVRRHGVQGAQSVAPEANADIPSSATSSSA